MMPTLPLSRVFERILLLYTQALHTFRAEKERERKNERERGREGGEGIPRVVWGNLRCEVDGVVLSAEVFHLYFDRNYIW